MNWIKQKVIKWIREDWEEERKEKSMNSIGIRPIEDTNVPETDPVLTFRIYNAQNGKILEFRRYNRMKDHSDVTTYIIGKDEDIAEKVSKCVTLEAMK